MTPFTINGKPATHDEAQRHFLEVASATPPSAALLALCPNGAPIIYGDLYYVWEGIMADVSGWEAYRAEVEKTGVLRGPGW